MDVTELREKILNFSLDDGPRGNQGYSRVLLQLFGYTGDGKSSFINSCKYVMDEGERFRQFAKAGGGGGAITVERKGYDLTKNITIVDNRNYIFMNRFQAAEIYAQLGNFIPIGEMVVRRDYTEMMERLEDAALDPNYSDFTVPILIYSAKLRLIVRRDRQEMQEFMENCVKMTGVFPIVVITNKLSGDFLEIEKSFQRMGAEVVISIENYTDTDYNKTPGRTRDILMVIHSALNDVTFRLGEKERSPRADWVQRKKFLMKYIYEADRERRRREEERRRREKEEGRR